MDKNNRKSAIKDIKELIKKISGIKKYLDNDIIDFEQSVLYEGVEKSVNALQDVVKTLDD